MAFKRKKVSFIFANPKVKFSKNDYNDTGISLKDLLMQGDLFQPIPDLDCLPEPILSYRARGTIKPAILACEEGDGSQDSCILKEKKLAVDKLLWVFEANSLVFGDLSTNFVKLRETLGSEGDVRVRRRARESSESSTALSEVPGQSQAIVHLSTGVHLQ
jgi:hypothetical protein